MSVPARTRRAQVWLDGPAEWSWPGRAAEAVEALPLPPSWVPAFPPRLEPLSSGAPIANSSAAWPRQRAARLRLLAVLLLSALLASCCAVLVLDGPGGFERALDGRTDVVAPSLSAATRGAPAPAPLPTLRAGSRDAAGSSIDAASFYSQALAGPGSFHVYLPPGYASTSARYPVLYLLHGNDQPATAFLALGLQRELDQLIAHHEVPPMIAVMIQGGRGANNWRNRYENYVIEVQQLVDRTLATQASRASRAIAGDSMGGYGAMNVALGHPQRFSVVESWLGFFNGLEDELQAARPVIAREGLHAYIYGGASDDIADPAENAPFAARLRAAGASAHSAIYVGGHTMETLQAHIHHMLLYIWRSLNENVATAPARAAGAFASGATGSSR